MPNGYACAFDYGFAATNALDLDDVRETGQLFISNAQIESPSPMLSHSAGLSGETVLALDLVQAAVIRLPSTVVASTNDIWLALVKQIGLSNFRCNVPHLSKEFVPVGLNIIC